MTRTVAGVVPFTSIDYPGYLAAVIFFQGCPLRCPFCHNPNLQPTQGESLTTWAETITFLKERTKRLDGVVFSGGEPLMQNELKEMIQEVKALGFKVAIHTSGVYDEKLAEILPLIDWVGLDIKAPWDKYDVLAGRKNVAEKVKNSLKALIQSGVKFDYQIVKLFNESVAAYPTGSTVITSNKDVAVVLRQNTKCPTRPVIRLISDVHGKVYNDWIEVDLTKEPTLFIQDSRDI